MPGSEYYNHTTYPANGAFGSASAMRAELTAIEAGFGKLPDLAGNGGEMVGVNAGGTALEAVTTTGTGNAVRATSPTFTTPALGVATCTSINKITITTPATGATLTLSDGSTLATSGGHSITLTSTGATNVTLPTTGTLATLSNLASYVDLSSAQSITGLKTFISLTFTSRIFGDFSNATLSNRSLLTTGTTNGATGVIAIPNGTAQVAAWGSTNNSDPDNAGTVALETGATEHTLRTSKTGSGTTRPLNFAVETTRYGRLTTAGRWLFGTSSITDDGASTVQSEGAVRAGGSIISGVTSSTAWNVDMTKNSATGYTAVTAGGTYDLASGSGLVFIHDEGNGDLGVFICYGGNVVKVAGPASMVASASPGATEIGLSYNAGVAKYRVTNGYATTRNLFISGIRTRFSP